MAVAKLCADANKQLWPHEKKELIALLPFASPTFSKLAQIGADKRLKGPIQKLLPPSYSIIYSVSQLKDNELDSAVKQKIITPTLKRADLDQWLYDKAFREPKIGLPSVNLPKFFFAGIHILKDLTEDETKDLEALLDQIQARFGAEVIRPRDSYWTARTSYNQRIFNHIKKAALKIVQRRRKATLHNVAKMHWSKYWPYKAEDLNIPADGDLEGIKRVLELVEVSFGVQF